MRGAAMRLGRNAVCTVAFGGLLLVGGAACADESAADAIAEKFSRAAADSERREAEAKKAEAERAVWRPAMSKRVARQIFAKAGYSGWLSFLMLLPFINLITLYVLAFSDWPAFRNKHTATA